MAAIKKYSSRWRIGQLITNIKMSVCVLEGEGSIMVTFFDNVV